MLSKMQTTQSIYFKSWNTTIKAFCFTQCKHSALRAMCYLSQVKQCKTSAMLYLNYVKPNTTSILCFSMHVQQNTNNTMYLLNHLTHKTINAFCLNQSKHSAINAMLFESTLVLQT